MPPSAENDHDESAKSSDEDIWVEELENELLLDSMWVIMYFVVVK